MAITYPRTMPTLRRPSEIRLTPVKVDGQTVDPFSLTTQTFEFPGERWEADITLSPMPRSVGQEWTSFLASLRGKVGSFNLYDPAAVKQGTLSGTVTASGTIRARTVTLSGGSGTLKAGDFITINSRYLHIITEDGATGGAVSIWPALRAAASGAIVHTNAYGRFVLNGAPSWASVPGDFIEVTPFSVIEDMRP